MSIAPIEAHQAGTGSRRPALRVIEGGRGAAAPPRGTAVHARREHLGASVVSSKRAHPTALAAPPRVAPRPADATRGLVDLGHEIDRQSARREAVRAQTASRRRRSVLALGVLASVVVLLLPVHAFGAVTLSGQGTPGGAPAGLAPGTEYVVPHGATLASIARLVNPGEVGVIERELASSIGSRTVVPGEHLVIP